jgi:hypothetical protein
MRNTSSHFKGHIVGVLKLTKVKEVYGERAEVSAAQREHHASPVSH